MRRIFRRPVNHLVTMAWSNNMALNLHRQNREGPVASIDNVSVDIAVVLGRTAMPIHQALRLGRGAIIELDASEEDEVSILANNLPVAKGTVIVSGNRIAVEVKKLLPRNPDAA
jgi:flagellar motor switch protein FliN